MPSHLLRDGDSIDILLANLGQEYENLIRTNAELKSKGLPPTPPPMTQAQMLDLVARAKLKNKV